MLERKTQLTFALSKSETGQEQTDDIQQNGQRGQQPETVKTDTGNDFVRKHVLVVRSGISEESGIQGKGMKIQFCEYR